MIIVSVAGVGAHEFVITVVSVVVVSPNESALPVQTVLAPTVIPASSITVPIKVVSAPSVVAAVGVQNTSHADAQLVKVTVELTVVSKAPSILKI